MDILLCILFAPLALLLALIVVVFVALMAAATFVAPLAIILELVGFDKAADKIAGWLL